MRMRCQLFIKRLFCSLLCIGPLCLTGVAFAQVYKSYDANGNVVFSDKPSTRSKEINIGEPNLTDPFKMPPPPADTSLETKPAKPEPEAETQPNADEDSADTNNDGRISRREIDEYRKEQRKKKREREEAAAGN